MSDMKTRATEASAEEFLASIADERRREECRELARLMTEITGEPPVMWGDSIVGFGHYRYRYESGRTGEWFLTGFSPRKQNLTLYIMAGFDAYDELLTRLGKHACGKSCLYLKRLSDVDQTTLAELISRSVERMKGLKTEG